MFTEPDWKNKKSTGTVSIGVDTVIRENVIINHPGKTDSCIGSNCYIMNTCFIGHDCVIGDGVTVCPHACIAGHVHIGDYTTIGMNASIHQGSNIGKCCMIGAGSFFKGVSPDGLTWGGVPARPLKVNIIGIERSNLSNLEKEQMILKAIDSFKYFSNIQTKNRISSTCKKAVDVILYCIGWFNLTNVFNIKFRL